MNSPEIESIYEFPYKLDNFQENSINSILRGEHVLVTAHTSAGKSTVAEFGIALANSKGKRSIYTSPIKALSNQKYGDFQNKITDASVGIMTGDIKVNPDADVLVATTEIVNNLLYTNIEFFDEVFCIVLDEVHYIRDKDRGKVWESVIAMMPKHVVLIMLSASIPGAEGFANWVKEIKDQECNLYSTSYRPVPLEHNVYWNGEFRTIVDQTTGKFDAKTYKSMYSYWQEYNAKRPVDKKTNSTLMIEFLKSVEESSLFPALFFEFSRKSCEKYAKMIQRSWLTGKEQTECSNLFDRYIMKYLGEKGMQLEQVWFIKNLLMKGVCIHHSGLIPILKEIIETIFDKGFIKVMFVTETFSVGINMPTKAVVFGSLQKFDGTSQRILIPEEYCQMSGRAGRRGKDTLGTVIYFPMPPKPMLRGDEIITMIEGNHSSIKSKFVIDPVILLKCVEIQKDPNEIIESTLMYQELKNETKGVEIEFNRCNEKVKSLPEIPENILNDYEEMKEIEKKMQFQRPKQKKNSQSKLRGLRDKMGLENQKLIASNNQFIESFEKIKNIKNNCLNYVRDTLLWQVEILIKTGFITNSARSATEFDIEKLSLNIKGKACTKVSETDSFLTIEYLNKFLSRIDDEDTEELITICLIFAMGSFVDDKECIRQENDGIWCVKDMLKELLTDVNTIDIVGEELNELSQTLEMLSVEERLENYETNISKLFGGYAYLWAVKKCSYNELVNQVGCEIYEGNFVRNMLKLNNICEEWKAITEIYQKPQITQILENLQQNIIREIVICDSLYIQS
tara:strand:- start:4715 stop:7093 length:2379 start_codon:yes stop_codon:yes gene_type:complete